MFQNLSFKSLNLSPVGSYKNKKINKVSTFLLLEERARIHSQSNQYKTKLSKQLSVQSPPKSLGHFSDSALCSTHTNYLST